MAAPTNNSEASLANKNDTSRLAYVLDALLSLSGFGGYGPTKANAHATGTGAAGGDAVSILGAGGAIGWVNANNKAATWNYLKFYNKATAPSSADVPIAVIPLPPGGGVFGPYTFPCTLGIGVRIVTGSADNDNTSIVSGDVTWNINYVAN